MIDRYDAIYCALVLTGLAMVPFLSLSTVVIWSAVELQIFYWWYDFRRPERETRDDIIRELRERLAEQERIICVLFEQLVALEIQNNIRFEAMLIK